ncbi:MAG: hypothetical protein IKP99_01495, partial [Bacteroidales bacterium]|nr:hypothetical protein [Bacteroidales bacterium]
FSDWLHDTTNTAVIATAPAIKLNRLFFFIANIFDDFLLEIFAKIRHFSRPSRYFYEKYP